MSEGLVNELKRCIRVKSAEAGEELVGLAESCIRELKLAGIYGEETDPTYRQAIRLYCKGHYGYDENTERFQEAFSSLRDAMALSGEYGKGDKDGSSAGMDG